MFESSPSPGRRPRFSYGWDFMMGLGKPHQRANFEIATFSHCRNIKGEIWGAPLAQGDVTFSSGCEFMMGLRKPKLHTKFEVAIFSRCRNIKGEPRKFRKLP